MAIDKSEKSLPALFSDLTRETVELVRKEIALGRSEISQKVSTAQTALTSLAIGAAILLAGLFIILQAAVHAVWMVLPPEMAPWLAPLLVGAVIALIGYIMVKGGSAKLKPDNLIPHHTLDSFKRDRAVAEEKVR